MSPITTGANTSVPGGQLGTTMDVDFELKPSSATEKNAADDVFGDEADHDIQYKTLSWQFVAAFMIAEIVSNGMLTLPNAMAVVGIVPSLVLTVFLGVFALYTAKLLIDFKLNHPEVHNMGDAGYIIFGPIGREVLSGGTIIFAIFAIGSEILSGQLALSVLSNNGLCATALLAIFAVATFLLSLPRTLGGLNWLGLLSAVFITICGILAMIGAGANPVSDRVVVAAVPTTFYEAFLAITGPVFSYAGHFMFFILISEMKKPEDAMKAAWVLQGFSTVFYVVFSVVIYVYIGSTVASPALLSLPPVWSKITFAIGMINFLMQVLNLKLGVLSELTLYSSGALYGHAAAKLVFFRFFRHSRHVHSHTPLGWVVWITLCFASTAAAFILATGVPIFSYLTGITASLFASWYTYGIAGFFWLHDTFYLKGGLHALRRKWVGTTLASSTVLAGAFICVAGTYVSIKVLCYIIVSTLRIVL
ncbi:transmembrane amino acid transporter protein-domain-containing protein [Trametes meyenii]|nr:transmembrane amino acid transporter protein-domain-containing protein [Trametes meyenii]